MGLTERNGNESGERGQGMVEYVLIVVLVVVVALVAFKLFGKQVKSLMVGANQEISAQTGK